MVDDDKPIHVDGEKARAGATPHMTRSILAISLIVLVLIYIAVLLFH